MVACLLIAVWLTIATRAFAESSVLLVVTGAADQDTAPYELRLRSEFGAEGFEVVTTSGRSQQNLLDLEGLARRTGAVAALSVHVDAQEVQGRLWVSDPNSNADLVRTLRVIRAEGDAVSVFALRAVEALRGARLELEQQRKRMTASGTNAGDTSGNTSATTASGAKPAQTGPAATTVPVPPKTNPNPPVHKSPQAVRTPPVNAKPAQKPVPTRGAPTRWTIIGGLVVGHDQNGLGSIWGPTLEARYRWSPRVSLGVAFDGPLIAQRHTQAGLVDVNQELLELQGRVALMQRKWVDIEGIASIAGSRFAVSGTVNQSSFVAGSAHSLGWTVGVGAGVALNLSSHWILGFDLEWLRRFPAPVVRAGSGHLTGDTDSLLLGKLGVGFTF